MSALCRYLDLNDLCQHVTCTPRNVLMRDKFCCQYCGSKQHLTLDHIVPISKGGKNTWSNLVTAWYVLLKKAHAMWLGTGAGPWAGRDAGKDDGVSCTSLPAQGHCRFPVSHRTLTMRWRVLKCINKLRNIMC